MTQSERAEEDEGEDDGGVDGALGAEDGEDRAGQRGERVGRGGERDVVVGERPVREVASPDERVERVVVDEPAARPAPRRRDRAGASSRWPCRGARARTLSLGLPWVGAVVRGCAPCADTSSPCWQRSPCSPPRPRARRCRAGTWSSTRAPRRARAAADSVAQLPLPGWTVESTFTAVQYGTPSFLTAADGTALGGGVNFFAGGPGGATSAATQVVDVSGAAAEIDAGQGRGDALRAARRLLGADRPRRGHCDLPERAAARRRAARSPCRPSRRPIAT